MIDYDSKVLPTTQFINLDVEKCNKLQPFVCKHDDLKNGSIRLLKKSDNINTLTHTSYLWGKTGLNKNDIDKHDSEVIGKTLTGLVDELLYHQFRKYYLFKFVTFHKYGYAEGLIRPDIREACEMIPDVIYDKSHKIFITTKTFGDGDISKYFVEFINMYLGETYVLCVVKNDWIE